MKIAFAGKGGAGKTSLTAWMGDYLARCGHNVWLVDADTAVSLGQACGLARQELPEPLCLREDLIMERIGRGFLNLSPEVADLPEALSRPLPLSGPPFAGATPGKKRLLVMGSVAGADGGCACAANALLKALLAHLILTQGDWVLIDLEAGVEHLGRGTVRHVDALAVVSEPSFRSLEVAAQIGALALELGLDRQVLVLNSSLAGEGVEVRPSIPGLPRTMLAMAYLEGLRARQLDDGSVLGLPEAHRIDAVCRELAVLCGAEPEPECPAESRVLSLRNEPV